jgi:hypothetical protein
LGRSFIFGDCLKAGQCRPVLSNTTMLGIRLLFTPKTVQARGKAASQVTLKWMHFRQSGARFSTDRAYY